VMDSLAIHGISLTTTQRRNQTDAPQRGSNNIRLQSPSATPQRRSQVGVSSMRFAQAQHLRPSPPKPDNARINKISRSLARSRR
ncbi:unnamed protein product, partial [Rotaria magnacalcarata]